MALRTCVICKSANLEDDEFAKLTCKDELCWVCLKDHINKYMAPKVACPICRKIFIDDANLRKALNEEEISKYEQMCWESVNLIKCLLEDCECFVSTDSDSLLYECQVCTMFNCTSCPGVHPTMSCTEYKTKRASKNKKDLDEVKAMEEEEKSRAKKKLEQFKADQSKAHLDELEQTDLIANASLFICSICEKKVAKGDGVVLRRCNHKICKGCLHSSIVNADKIPITCPENECNTKLEDREIQTVLTDKELNDYNLKLIDSVKLACNDVFQCKTIDCPNFVIGNSSIVSSFNCNVCHQRNCLKCFSIHSKDERCGNKNETKQYKKNKQHIEAGIKSGKFMYCPHCTNILQKKGGCNLICCSNCKLEVCWVLKIPRWGPKGHGDNSGGCGCTMEKTCAPECKYGCFQDSKK